MTRRPPMPMLNVQLRLAAGGWVSVCRSNAERLEREAHIEVQHKTFLRGWTTGPWVYAARMQFRARQRS